MSPRARTFPAPRAATLLLALHTALLALLATVASAPAAPTLPLPEDGSLEDARAGLEHLYHARLDSAAAAFERIRARDPGSPAADFLRGGIEWHVLTTGPQGFTAGGVAQERFFARMDSAIALGERRLEENPDDVATRFFTGGAYGYKARYLALQEEWWSAYRTGRHGVSHLERVVKEDPDLEDAYLGLGIFHYYADVLPGVLKVLGMLVGMGGDAERGLAEIRRSVRDGVLVGVEGRFFLAEIYTTFEEDHWTAYGFSRGLHDEYPENELFTWVNARVLDELHLTELSTPQWLALRQGHHDRTTEGFLDYRLARSLLFGGDFAGAAGRFDHLLKYGRLGTRRMAMWGRLRYGMALDFLGRHPEAMKQYRLAHDLDASDSARDRTGERLSAGQRDPSIISLTELEEVAAILRDTGSGGAAAVDVTEQRLTGVSRGMSSRDEARYFEILATLGQAHLARGDAAACEALADRALSGTPRPSRSSRATLLEVRARARARMNRTDEAREDLRSARAASSGGARDRYEALAALLETPVPASPGSGPFVLSFTAPDRGELLLEVEGGVPGGRAPMALRAGTWSLSCAVPAADPVLYRFVADGSSYRPDPLADRVVMRRDEPWCLSTPQPRQTKSAPSR